jgi:hypothetical protein
MKRKFTGNTEHTNALFKLIKFQGMMLQIDAAKRLNRKDIGTTAEKLEQEGKIKRQKVKLRQPMGNLVDVWLLYMPNTDQNKILDYERELINRPFESPLKENHCYKKVEPEETTGIIVSENLNNSDNVVHLKDYVKVNDCDLEIKEYNNQRIVTFKDIDQVHSRPEGTAKANFQRNKIHFIENEDYIVLTGEELRKVRQTYSVQKNVHKLILLTESGYLLLVKTFTDDLSWTVQRQLVNTYFKMKQLQQDPNNSQAIQSIDRLDILKLMIEEMQEHKDRINTLENKFNKLVNAISQ